jgi:signal transduction histidine kinase
VELSQAGLNSQTVFEFIQVEQEFLITTLEDNGSALKFTSPYPLKMVAGFMEEREKVIRREQENIRSAFQIALEHANTATRAAQVIAQEATELSYRKIIIAQEEERRRISRELHDDAGQTMVGLRMNLENIKTSLSSNPELEKEMEKALFWTDNAIRKIRSLAYRLRPPMLDLLGINLAIKQLCFDFSEQTDLVIHYNGIETPALNDELSISIYRIVQEALTNIIKHASANQAWIRLKYARELIELTIKDNGLGFDLETTRTGIGLNGMQERCQLLSGNMQIKSAKGKPTLLKFSFPVLAAHDQQFQI